MTTEDLQPDASAYWSAVLATLPVFALALVLEVRKNASRWADDMRVGRFLAGVGALGYSVLVAVIFERSLRALASGDDTSDAQLVNLGLSVLLGAAVGSPLVEVFARGTSDIRVSIWSRVPLSRVARMRRQVRRLEKKYEAILVSALDALEDVEATDAMWRRVQKYETQVRAVVEQDHRKKIARITEEIDRGEASEADLEQEKARIARMYAEMDEARIPIAALDTSGRVEEAWELLVKIFEDAASTSLDTAAKVEALAAEQRDVANAVRRAAQEQWSK